MPLPVIARDCWLATANLRSMNSDYETDFYASSEQQAALLQGGRFSQLDVQQVAEEIEDLGKREGRALGPRPTSRIRTMLQPSNICSLV